MRQEIRRGVGGGRSGRDFVRDVVGKIKKHVFGLKHRVGEFR